MTTGMSLAVSPPSISTAGKEYLCSACGGGYSTAQELEEHIAKHETPGGEVENNAINTGPNTPGSDEKPFSCKCALYLRYTQEQT